MLRDRTALVLQAMINRISKIEDVYPPELDKCKQVKLELFLV